MEFGSNPAIGVFGLGSAHGLDRIGWEAVDRLQIWTRSACAERRIDWYQCRAPIDMVQSWESHNGVILLDALMVPPDNRPVRRLAADELLRRSVVTSHGFGVQETLALANSLGIRPLVAILGIAVQGVEAPPADYLLQIRSDLEAGFLDVLRELNPSPGIA